MNPHDSDLLEHYEEMLSPAEKDALKWIMLDPTRPFCSKDLIDEVEKIKSKGTARNVIYELNRKSKFAILEVFSKSRYTFYKLKSVDRPKMKKPMTLYPMGVSGLKQIKIDLVSLLESMPWEELCKVHDVRLIFPFEKLYDFLLSRGTYKPDSHSKDINIGLFNWTNYRSVQVISHNNGKVSVILKCSQCPIETSVTDFVNLAAFLGGIRTEIFNLFSTRNESNKKLPNVGDWVVVAWHYGRDSAQEFSGESFNITFKMWCGILARIYTHLQDKKLKLRVEVAQTPNKSLNDLTNEKLNFSCCRCKLCSKQ